MRSLRTRHTTISESISRLVHKAHKLPVEEIKERLVDLSKESEVLEAAFECLTTGVLIADSEGFLRYANKAASRLLSLSSATDEEESVWCCADSKEISDFLKEAITSGNTNKSDEFSVSSASGAVHFITVAIQCLAKESRVLGSVITVQDVTERRKDEVRAHRMESLAELTNLAASMAHEIKNPLGAISIHVQLVQKAISIARGKDGALPAQKFIEEPLKVVSEEVNSLNSLVMQFLMAVRPVKAQLEILDVSAIVKEVVSFVAPEFSRHGFEAIAETGADKVRVLIDGRLMKEVFINMAQNSLASLIERFGDAEIKDEGGGGSAENKDGKAESINNGKKGQEGMEKGFFFIGVKAMLDVCVITVRDNAYGMSRETADRIFEPYFTTKADGTGLGMTMVYKIIKEFNGSIELTSSVKSLVSGGTVFTIKLPLPQTGKIKYLDFGL